MPEPISNAEAQRRWRERHKDEPAYKAKKGARDAAWKRDNTERNAAHRRKSWLKNSYGLTVEQYEELFASQGLKCAVCSADTPRGKRGWCVDHCHTTGVVRGILCHHCNTMLGMAQDSPVNLVKAADYLNRNNHAR